MIIRTLAALVLVWLIGFLWFSVTLPGAVDDGVAEAVIVPTGAAGRIQRGLEIVQEKQADRIFVSGVDSDVTPQEFAVEFEVSEELMKCCVMLGFEAADTRGNAVEIADWVAREKIKSLRFVTSDWHMRRAGGELASVLPDDVAIIRDAVATQPSLGILFIEYHKFVASSVRTLLDL